MGLIKRKEEMEKEEIVEEGGGVRRRAAKRRQIDAHKSWKKGMEAVEEWKGKQAEESNRKKIKGH